MQVGRRWWETAKFNKLRIVEEPDYQDVTNNGPRVKCVCDCGKEKTTRLYPLKGGRVRSCGCWQKEGVTLRNKKRAGYSHKERTGDRQGRLTFLEYAGSTAMCAHWKVRCDCGEVFTTRGTTKSKACHGCASEAKRGRRSPCWKGGRHKNPSGYVVIHKPDHPRASKQGYVLEHIVVAEEAYGKPIYVDQSVHHRNGIRDDNAPANLEVWDKAHPTGQRLDEKMEFYKAQLLLKAPDTLLEDLYLTLRAKFDSMPHDEAGG